MIKVHEGSMRLTELFLFEAKCPLCGTEGGYQSFSSFECKNPKCRNYVRPKGGTVKFLSPEELKREVGDVAFEKVWKALDLDIDPSSPDGKFRAHAWAWKDGEDVYIQFYYGEDSSNVIVYRLDKKNQFWVDAPEKKVHPSGKEL